MSLAIEDPKGWRYCKHDHKKRSYLSNLEQWKVQYTSNAKMESFIVQSKQADQSIHLQDRFRKIRHSIVSYHDSGKQERSEKKGSRKSTYPYSHHALTPTSYAPHKPPYPLPIPSPQSPPHAKHRPQQ